jgi:2-oxoisovalerate dehydrogenase E2 component (dihydrolipoyl transacylase)
MGIYILKTPDIGEGIAEVELVAWHVAPGDTVTMDQILADVMTDKATVEVPSPVAGKVLAIGGTIGQTVAVGSELVRLEVEGEGNLKGGAPLEVAALAVTSNQTAAKPASKSVAPPAAVTAASTFTAHRPATERPIASPAVRRRAWELNVDLQRVPGSGPAGRITQVDLESYATAHPAPTVAAKAPVPPERLLAQRVTSGNSALADVSIPVIGLRRKIAIKMQDSKRRIPHFTYVEELDVSEIEALRERLNGQWGETRGRLTMLPLLVRALALAVREFPQMNARFDDDVGVVSRFGAMHVGIATQTDNGLMVPVVRDAQAHDLWSNAAEIARVAQAARSGRATREELSGSTITITSLGALGGIVTTPVINHPEVAIIGVNRMVQRPVVLHGAIVVRRMMNLSSSFDHRVVDGLDAARFVQAIRAYLEVPATLFVE